MVLELRDSDEYVEFTTSENLFKYPDHSGPRFHIL